MRSAFGIEHTVSKSLVNGVFKPAREMSSAERGAVKVGGAFKQAKQMSPEHSAFKEMRRATDAPVAAAIAAGPKNNPHIGLGTAVTLRQGGPSSGRSTVLANIPKGVAPKKVKQTVMRHEAVHAGPKRSSYRLHGQISADPKKLMREEAHADYIAGGHYSKHPDGGSMYAQAARVHARLTKDGPEAPFKFGRKDKANFKLMGMKPPKVTNRQSLDASKSIIQQAFPHYHLEGKKGDDAIGAYKDLHDQLRAKGVKRQ